MGNRLHCSLSLSITVFVMLLAGVNVVVEVSTDHINSRSRSWGRRLVDSRSSSAPPRSSSSTSTTKFMIIPTVDAFQESSSDLSLDNHYPELILRSHWTFYNKSELSVVMSSRSLLSAGDSSSGSNWYDQNIIRVPSSLGLAWSSSVPQIQTSSCRGSHQEEQHPDLWYSLDYNTYGTAGALGFSTQGFDNYSKPENGVTISFWFYPRRYSQRQDGSRLLSIVHLPTNDTQEDRASHFLRLAILWDEQNDADPETENLGAVEMYCGERKVTSASGVVKGFNTWHRFTITRTLNGCYSWVNSSLVAAISPDSRLLAPLSSTFFKIPDRGFWLAGWQGTTPGSVDISPGTGFIGGFGEDKIGEGYYSDLRVYEGSIPGNSNSTTTGRLLQALNSRFGLPCLDLSFDYAEAANISGANSSSHQDLVAEGRLLPLSLEFGRFSASHWAGCLDTGKSFELLNPSTPTSSPSLRGLHLNGSLMNGHDDNGDPSSSTTSSWQDLTLSFWYRPATSLYDQARSNPDSTILLPILSSKSSGGEPFLRVFMNFFPRYSTGLWCAGMSVNSPKITERDEAGISLDNEGQWYHFVVIRTARECQLYLNNLLMVSLTVEENGITDLTDQSLTSSSRVYFTDADESSLSFGVAEDVQLPPGGGETAGIGHYDEIRVYRGEPNFSTASQGKLLVEELFQPACLYGGGARPQTLTTSSQSEEEEGMGREGEGEASPTPSTSSTSIILIAVLVTIVLVVTLIVVFLVLRWKQRQRAALRTRQQQKVTDRIHHSDQLYTASSQQSMLPPVPSGFSGTSSSFGHHHEGCVPTSSSPGGGGVLFKKGKLIGAGGFGKVYLGMNERDGSMLAAKEILVDVEDPELKKKTTMLLEAEVDTLRSLNHPHIVQYLGCEMSEEGEACYILMEWMSAGSLSATIKNFGSLNHTVAAKYTRDALLGLEYLHQRGLIHRDVKAANMLLSNEGRVKLSDLGSAQSVHSAVSMRGTSLWVAPEAIRETSSSRSLQKPKESSQEDSAVSSTHSGGGVGPPSDIWSLGCTVIEMLTGKMPFAWLDLTPFGVMALVAGGGPKLQEALAMIPEIIKFQPAAELVMACLQDDPLARPTATQLLYDFNFIQLAWADEQQQHQQQQDRNPSGGGDGKMPSDASFRGGSEGSFANSNPRQQRGLVRGGSESSKGNHPISGTPTTPSSVAGATNSEGRSAGGAAVLTGFSDIPSATSFEAASLKTGQMILLRTTTAEGHEVGNCGLAESSPTSLLPQSAAADAQGESQRSAASADTTVVVVEGNIPPQSSTQQQVPTTVKEALTWSNIRPKAVTFRKGKLLGSGGFGKVYLGLDEVSGKLIAAKEITFDDLGEDNTEEVLDRVKALGREISVMKKLHHPNVVTYLGSDRVGDSSFFIFMEFVPGGSLRSTIETYSKLPEALAASFTMQALSGLEYLHRQGVVHRDLKCANMLLDSEGVVKLADLGCAQNQNSISASLRGTPYWMAPEVIRQEVGDGGGKEGLLTFGTTEGGDGIVVVDRRNNASGRSNSSSSGIGTASDIWSLGCCVMEMVTGNSPFEWLGNAFAVMSIVARGGDELTNALHDEERLPEGLRSNPLALDFVRVCCRSDPADRPSAKELRASHPFIQLVVVADTPSGKQEVSSGVSSSKSSNLLGRKSMGLHEELDDDYDSPLGRKSVIHVEERIKSLSLLSAEEQQSFIHSLKQEIVNVPSG